MKNRYIRYILYSIAIITFGGAINAFGIPDFFKLNEWCELGYRSRDSMINMTAIFVILGIALFLFGSILFVYAMKHYSISKKQLLNTGSNDSIINQIKASKFETFLIMFLILSILNITILLLKEPVFRWLGV